LCVQDTPTLLEQFQKLWERRKGTGDPPIKVGVDVVELVAVGQASGVLFEEVEKPRRVSAAVDDINKRWGGTAIYFGTMHGYRHRMDDKIAFGRIPPTV